MGLKHLRQLRARVHEAIGFNERAVRDPYEQPRSKGAWDK